MFQEENHNLDFGFKVFDSVDAPKLSINLENGEVEMPTLYNDSLSRIYNIIFTVGLDNPTKKLEEIVKDCMYKIGENYYLTNCDKIPNKDF